MKVLVLNCGSSSIKYKLFDMTSGSVMAQGGIEKIGLPHAFLKLTDKDGKKVILEKEIPGHKEGIEFILSILTDETYGCIKEYKEIDAVGHRVVHLGHVVAAADHGECRRSRDHDVAYQLFHVILIVSVVKNQVIRQPNGLS